MDLLNVGHKQSIIIINVNLKALTRVVSEYLNYKCSSIPYKNIINILMSDKLSTTCGYKLQGNNTPSRLIY